MYRVGSQNPKDLPVPLSAKSRGHQQDPLRLGMRISFALRMTQEPLQPRVVATADGSDTLQAAETGVTYHSLHGAVTESRHVFVGAGLEHCWSKGQWSFRDPPCMKVLELGLGSGLNAALGLEWCREKAVLQMEYTALEPHSLDTELLLRLNYRDFLRMGAWESWLSRYPALREQLLLDGHAAWTDLAGPTGFTMKVRASSWWEPLEVLDGWDVLFYDAFGPAEQPDLWEMPAAERIASCLCPGGVMVTYGAQGAFRRHLQACGLGVERLPGPPGKREMLRATKV